MTPLSEQSKKGTRQYMKRGQKISFGMNKITEHFEKETTVHGVFVAFMEAIEEWQSQVEGSPTDDEMRELDKIYDIAEVEMRFIINNDTKGSDLQLDKPEIAGLGDANAQSDTNLVSEGDV